MNLLAYRLYVGADKSHLTRLLAQPLEGRAQGLIFLCGRLEDSASELGNCHDIGENLRLTPGWNFCYLGEGKEGYTTPWRLLFEVVRRAPSVQRILFSDADDQISHAESLRVLAAMNCPVVLPRRLERNFGAYTFERNVIEDIENAFVHHATGRLDVRDFQAGLYLFERRLTGLFNFEEIRNTKWIGDLFAVEQILQAGIPIQEVVVESSDEHNTSSIFDYASPLNEILIGQPALKMNELVKYFGVPLTVVQQAIHAQPEAYLHTLVACPRQPAKGGRGLADVLAYVDFLVGLYQRTADIYGFTI